jgi:hypothetical protein
VRVYQKTGFLVESGAEFSTVVWALRQAGQGVLAEKLDCLRAQTYYEPVPRSLDVEVEVVRG